MTAARFVEATATRSRSSRWHGRLEPRQFRGTRKHLGCRRCPRERRRGRAGRPEQRRTEIVTGRSGLSGAALSSIAALGNDFFANGDFDGGLSAILAGLQREYAGGGVANPSPTVAKRLVAGPRGAPPRSRGDRARCRRGDVRGTTQQPPGAARRASPNRRPGAVQVGACRPRGRLTRRPPPARSVRRRLPRPGHGGGDRSPGRPGDG